MSNPPIPSPEIRTGRVILINGQRFFSPNSRREVRIPPPNPPISGVEDTFWGRKPRLNQYLVPRWLTQEYGFLAYLPLRPTFFGDLLEPLRTIPPVESDGKDGFRLPLATLNAWCTLEADLSFVINALNFKGTGYVVYHFPAPSSFGYNRSHATQYIAERQARISRDWFMMLMGAVSYVVFAYRFPSWFESLKELGCRQAWIASLEASSVMDRDFERVGCFMIWKDPTRSHPQGSLLRKLKVPMWFPWRQREVDDIADMLRRHVRVDRFWYPSQEELDNPTIFNYYDDIPPVVSYRRRRPFYNPPAFRRLPTPPHASPVSVSPAPASPVPIAHSWSTPPPSTPARVGTPPSPDSGQRPGQTWEEFFKERDALRASETESDRHRQAREARERQPGRNKSDYFEWRRNSAHEWVRHKVHRQEGQRLVDGAEPGEYRYDAWSDSYDICEDFISPGQQPTAQTDFAEDEDFNDYEIILMTGATKGLPAPASSSAASFPTVAPVVGSTPATAACVPVVVRSNRSFAPRVANRTDDVVQDVPQRATCVPPRPPPPPFEESIVRPPLLDFLRVRYGFVSSSAILVPPIPPSAASERASLISILRMEPSEFERLSDIVYDALVTLMDILIGEGRGGGQGLRDMPRPESTLSIRGVSNQPIASRRQRKNAKKHRPEEHASSSSSILEPGEIASGSGVPMSVDGPEEREDVRPRLRPEIWDMHPSNPHHLHVFSRILQARKLVFSHGRNADDTRPCYMLSFPSDSSWSLGLMSTQDLLHVCRLRLDNSVRIASTLLQIGIPFRTLVRLPPDWKPQEQGTDFDLLSLPTPMEIPYRGKGYSFGATDYAIHERQRQMLISQRHVRASCLAGGIVWRLARDLLREEEVLSGPTETAVVFGDGVFYRDAAGNLWCDDALTVDEMDLICGMHSVGTGNVEQTAKMSYWPLQGTWTNRSAGMCPGWWAYGLEVWFNKRRSALRQGLQQPLTASGWRGALKGNKRSTRLKHRLEDIAVRIIEEAGL